MANKSNIRSIRFSDEFAELINQQIGDTFQARFENLITKCVRELPKKQEELERLEKQIKKKQQQMAEASSRYARMINQLSNLEQKMHQLDFAIGKALDEWPSSEA